MAIVAFTGCASVQDPSPYRVASDGAKEFALRMELGNFWPNYLVVKQGDRVRLVLYSSYEFALFSFPQFNITRQIPHGGSDAVEFLATQRGWFDFYAYVTSPLYGGLTLVRDFGGRNGRDQTIYGRLYVQ
jgi:hypothetical protein